MRLGMFGSLSIHVGTGNCFLGWVDCMMRGAKLGGSCTYHSTRSYRNDRDLKVGRTRLLCLPYGGDSR